MRRLAPLAALAVLLSATAAAAVFLGLMREPGPSASVNDRGGAKEAGEPKARSVNVSRSGWK